MTAQINPDKLRAVLNTLARPVTAVASAPEQATIRTITLPDGKVTTTGSNRTTRVVIPMPSFGLKCTCYENMREQDIAPLSKPYSMQTKCGGWLSGRTFNCNCINKSRGSTVTTEQMPAIIPGQEFRRAVGDALCNLLNLPVKQYPMFLSEVGGRNRSNLIVAGIGTAALGGVLVYWLIQRKHRKIEHAE